MPNEERLLLAILSNVNSSIRRVNFGPGWRVAYHPLADLLPILTELDGLPDSEVKFNLTEQYHATDVRRRVWVVEAHVDLDVPPRKRNETADSYWLRNTAGEMLMRHRVQERISLVRLMCDVPAHLCALYLYTGELGNLQPSFSQRIDYYVVPERGTVTASAAATISRRSDCAWLPFKRDYVALAHASFEESFQVEQVHLRLLLLTISLEVLFNDGQGEVTYKIARGAAALLGRSKVDSHEIFKRLKDLYGKRSQLVHSGKSKIITDHDVALLRSTARRAILRAAALDCDKSELIARLTASGFGAYARLRA